MSDNSGFRVKIFSAFEKFIEISDEKAGEFGPKYRDLQPFGVSPTASWGNTGPATEEKVVPRVREPTQERQYPWTETELT